MPECHNCPHNGKASRACLRCDGPAETNHHGESHVTMDSETQQSRPVVDAVLHPASKPGYRPAAQVLMEQMARFARHLFEADYLTYMIIRARFNDPQMPLATIAKRHRITTQAVHQRLQRCAEIWPGVRVLIGLRLTRDK